MILFIKTTFFSFTIWLLAAIINGLLYAAVFVSGELVNNNELGESFIAVTLFSLFFSIPAAFCFWLVFLNNNDEDDLSVRLLRAACILSSLSCFIIFLLPSNIVNGHWFCWPLSSLHHPCYPFYCTTRFYNLFINNLKPNLMYKLIVQVRTNILVCLTHQMALPILHFIRKPQSMPYTKAQLQQLREGILGRDLINMLEKNDLQLLPHYVKHDIKHIVLEYPTTDKGEVCLQSFMLGNGHLSFPVAATILFGLLTMPEHWLLFLKAFKRGEKSITMDNWPWFSLLELPTQSLIQKINTHENHN